MGQTRVSYSLVVTIGFVCLGLSVVMCSESSDSLIKTYVSNNYLVNSAMLKEVQKISGSEWNSLVLESNLPVMVTFTADWCGACRLIYPQLEIMDLTYTDRFTFYTLNIDEERSIAIKYAVRNIPTNIVFKGGVIVDTYSGVSPTRLWELVRKHV